MRNRTPSAATIVDSPFEAVRQRFADWRQTRRPSSPIPEELWGEAVALARTHGVNRTAQALHLSYASLKQRLDASVHVEPVAAALKPTFVELISPISVGLAECTVEWERPGEAILRIHLKSATLRMGVRSCLLPIQDQEGKRQDLTPSFLGELRFRQSAK
jgi:hypothetical protein